MTFKSLRVPTLGLAAVVAMAATPGPAVADFLTEIALIPVPPDAQNTQPNQALTSFDISFADPQTGNVYIADRSNASVDIFDGSKLTFLGRATGFVGQTGNNNTSGADGVLTVTSGGVTTIYGGDGNSTLRVYNATTANPGSPTFVAAIGPTATAPPPPFTRVDEMAYSPLTSQVLAANNATTPAFASLFSTNFGHDPVTLIGAPPPGNQITVPASQGGFNGGGMEQPVWNPFTKTFFVSIPQLTTGGATDPGGVSQIDPNTGKVTSTTSFALNGISSCSPTGLAISTGGNMLAGCSNVGTQAVLLDKNGNVIGKVAGLGGTDQIWYDPATNRFYVTGNDGTNTGRFIDVVTTDGTVTFTLNLPATTSAHSVAVDPFNGNVFVALAGLTPNGVCPLGCIAVFNQVPGPIVGAGLPGLILASGALVALARRRRQRVA